MPATPGNNPYYAIKPTVSKNGRRIGRPVKPRYVAYKRPKLYAKQEAAIFDPVRIAIIEAGTKTGKTTGCLAWLVEQACLNGAPGRDFWWIAPSYKQAAIAFRRIQRYLPQGTFATNSSSMVVVLMNGARISFLTGEKPDLLYGEDVYACVMDEATRMRVEAWYAIRSTLTATQGPVRLIGNVKGTRNFVHQLALRAIAGRKNLSYHLLTAWDAVEAGVLPLSEVEDARDLLPEAVFNELYLGIPTEDGANPFGLAALKRVSQDQLAAGPAVAYGIDLAKHQNMTEIIGLNAHRRMCHYQRFQLGWKETMRRIRSTIGRVPTLVDSTGVGDPIVELLQTGPLPPRVHPGEAMRPEIRVYGAGWEDYENRQRASSGDKDFDEFLQACPNVTGFLFGAHSRQQLLEQLAVMIQHGECGIFVGERDCLIAQFESFEYAYNAKQRTVRWQAPEGMPDDGVMAYGMAIECFRTRTRAQARAPVTVTF